MKKILLLLVSGGFLLTTAAQKLVKRELKEAMKLQMPRTADDERPGTRGAAVAWHPLQKKYYASMAGNKEFPMAVFSATGKQLSSDTLNCNIDTRGLWYNVVKKELQGNGYADNGWFRYGLNAAGIPVKTTLLIEGQNQPNEHCVGAFNTQKQQVLFLHEGRVFFYSLKGEETGTPLTIHWGMEKTAASSSEKAGDVSMESATPADYNYTTLIYTGIKGAELGFLNTTSLQIELYSIADGFLSGKLILPLEAAANMSFNFSYTNGMFWLFNIDDRIWTAYK